MPAVHQRRARGARIGKPPPHSARNRLEAYVAGIVARAA
jgi:hypothetical protein